MGTEHRFERGENYNKINDCEDGMFMVSDLKSCGINDRYVCLDYHSDYENDTGFWGYTDETGKEIIKPQFTWVDFFADCTFKIAKYNSDLCRSIEEIIDRNGKTIFTSKYTSLSKVECGWLTMIREKGGRQIYGLIGKNENEILQCKYDRSYYTILPNKQLIIFKSGDKYGLMTFNEEIIIEAKYAELSNIQNKFLKAKLGWKEGLVDDGKYGLISFDGMVIVPFDFERISIDEDTILAGNDSGTTVYKIIMKYA